MDQYFIFSTQKSFQAQNSCSFGELCVSKNKTITNDDFSVSFYSFAKLNPEFEKKEISTPTETRFLWGHVIVNNKIHLTLSDLPQESDWISKNINNIDGIYIAIQHNKVQKKIFCYTDRYGYAPLYYYSHNDQILISNSFHLLALHIKEQLSINTLAIHEFFYFHLNSDTKTLCKEINRSSLGCYIEIDLQKKTISEQPYYNIHKYQKNNNITFKNVTNSIFELFNCSIKKRIHDQYPIDCLLSGGYDSRICCAALHYNKIDFTTKTTYGDTGTMDDPISAQILAEVFQIPNTYIPLPEDYIERYWKTKSTLTGYSTSYHTWLMPLSLAPQSKSINFDGILGDSILSGSRDYSIEILNTIKQCDKNTTINLIHSKYKFPRSLQPNGIFNSQTITNSSEAALHALFLSFQQETSENLIDINCIKNRARRSISTAPFSILSFNRINTAPFIDIDLFDYLMSVPLEYRLDDALYFAVMDLFKVNLSKYPSSNHKSWPEQTPKHRKPIHLINSEKPLLSYFNCIDLQLDNLNQFINITRYNNLKERCIKEPNIRTHIIRDIQSLAEVALFLNTYNCKISL